MNLEHEDIPGEAKPVVLMPIDEPRRGGIKLQQMMFAVGVCAVVAWLAIMLGALFVAGSFVLLLALVIGMIVIFVRRGSSRKQSLIWVMAIAAERSMPLADAILAFADQFGRSYRWRVYQLASLLKEGFSLPAAISQVRGGVSHVAEVLIRTGESTGTLPRSLREAASLPSTRQASWGDTAARFFYLGWLLFVMQVINGFILYFIIPKFEAIFKDFGVSLPEITIFRDQYQSFFHQILLSGCTSQLHPRGNRARGGLAGPGAELLCDVAEHPAD